jgi:hypothetical protein
MITQVALLVYAQIDPVRKALATTSGPTKWVPLFSGPYPDFTEQWFAVVGAQIIVTLVLNMLLPLVPLIQAVLAAFCCAPRKSNDVPGNSQEQINQKDLFSKVKGNFGLAERYGVSYNSSVLLMFQVSSSLPVCSL